VTNETVPVQSPTVTDANGTVTEAKGAYVATFKDGWDGAIQVAIKIIENRLRRGTPTTAQDALNELRSLVHSANEPDAGT
jgi:hypothetical protein